MEAGTAVTHHDKCAHREINKAWEGMDYKWSNSNTESPASPLHDSTVLSSISTQPRKYATFPKNFPNTGSYARADGSTAVLKYAAPGWAPLLLALGFSNLSSDIYSDQLNGQSITSSFGSGLVLLTDGNCHGKLVLPSGIMPTLL